MTTPLLDKAKKDMIADMESRQIGAILWDNATAGFHYIPVATLPSGKVVNITGLYHYGDDLYLVEEENPRADINNYYNHDTEVKPTVVCLSDTVARGDLGNPGEEDGFTLDASMEEWLAIADCYFEALAEK
ncbi:MAG: hypothetical protein K2O24_01855 [Muribaculaceae bacterium]|nr:hypothetical protein [Muribaculaceae bacterium]